MYVRAYLPSGCFVGKMGLLITQWHSFHQSLQNQRRIRYIVGSKVKRSKVRAQKFMTTVRGQRSMGSKVGGPKVHHEAKVMGQRLKAKGERVTKVKEVRAERSKAEG